MRAVLEQLSRQAPQSDAEMLDGYRRTGARLVDYARAHTALRRTGGLPARSRRDAAAAARLGRGRRLLPGAALQTRGIGRFYVTPTGDDAAVLRAEHNYAAMPDLAAHEGFPGHDWDYRS